jgi:thiol-disulfide isomerase/thioredoxin
MNTKNKSVLWDILVGIITAVISFIILEKLKLNMALIAISPLPLIAGFIRGKTPAENRFIKVILMNLLFLLLIMAIMNGAFHLILILAVTLIGTTLGIYVRLYFSKETIKAFGFLSLYSLSVLFLGFFVLPAWLDSAMWEKVNRQAPNFTLLTLDGDTIKSSEYTDKVIILDFWATLCGPCKKQFPVIENLYKENKENNNVAFFIINPQIGGDTFEKALKFINQSGYDLPFVNDIESLTYKNLKVTALPCLVIIDKEGVVRYTHTGYDESENFYKIFHKHLDTILNQNESY